MANLQETYFFLGLEFEDWQFEDFQKLEPDLEEVTTESQGYVSEKLIIKEKDNYTLTIQGLNPTMKKILYNKIRESSHSNTTETIALDNPVVDRNYIGENESEFEAKLNFRKSRIIPDGIMFKIRIFLTENRVV